jgi:hypothetical protein
VQRFLALCLLVLFLAPKPAHGEWQLKPFGGVTFGGNSPFVDLDGVQGHPKLNLGTGIIWQGEVIGLEGDVATTSGFFSGKKRAITQSHVATLTGNLLIALPRRMSEYSLRPYMAVGIGTAHTRFSDGIRTFDYSKALPSWDIGGGATGFISDTVGLNWDFRLFRTLRPQEPQSNGAVVEKGKLSFWRLTMGFAFRL